jgi:hypothetical protein
MRNRLNPSALAAALALAALSPAQEPEPAPAPPEAPAKADRLAPAKADAPTKDDIRRAADAVCAAKAADDLDAALVRYFRAQLATKTIFAGQHDRLAPCRDAVLPTLLRWAVEAPDSLLDSEELLRQAVVAALRDLLGKEAPDAVRDALRAIAKDSFESQGMRLCAMFALAQFGDRARLDPLIAQLKKATHAEKPALRADALRQLADVYYNLREFAASSATYDELLAMEESGAIDLDATFGSAPSFYYNAACSASLGGDLDVAFHRLGQALARGAESGDQLANTMLRQDGDIARLREDPRFAELMTKYYGDPGETDKAGSDKAGSDKTGSDKTGSDKTGTQSAGTQLAPTR